MLVSQFICSFFSYPVPAVLGCSVWLSCAGGICTGPSTDAEDTGRSSDYLSETDV